MGNSQSSIKINYEDIQFAVRNPSEHVLINTLPSSEQSCLIKGTLHISREEELINQYLRSGNKSVKILIYGKHCNDDTVVTKYNQLSSLGFHQVYVYMGGMFEWLMLQDIYGEAEFPTSSKELNMLKFRPHKCLNVPLLEY